MAAHREIPMSLDMQEEHGARTSAVEAVEEFEAALSRTLRITCGRDPHTVHPEIPESEEQRLARPVQRRLRNSQSDFEELIVDGSRLTLRVGAPPQRGLPVTRSDRRLLFDFEVAEWTTDTYEMRYQASCAAPRKLWREGELPVRRPNDIPAPQVNL